MPADFFAGLPNEGETINAPAARQLMKSKRLVFMNISSLFDSVARAAPKRILSRRHGRAGIEPWDCRDLPLFRDCIAIADAS
jgi:hypothetical protein